MRRYLILALILFVLPSLCLASRGISLNIKKPDGGTEQIPLYKESHALLIGVSDYTNGWPDLESIPGEMEELEIALKGQGFTVEKVLNPDSQKLSDTFENFVDRYGYDKENRLLFFFSGHGYSRLDGKKGYIVPTDAPNPTLDEKGFLRKAVGMSKILTWARQVESKHAMFLFDSCFSGTVFKSRALPNTPPHISSLVTKPVRQFISAGSAGEEVPARSVFVPSFIKALNGEGDIDKDGYITGTELGMFLHKKVTSYSHGQTPQYGKIRDPDLDEGDFILVSSLPKELDSSPVVTTPSAPKPVMGSLIISSIPSEAKWYLDGSLVGKTPGKFIDLKPGKYNVEVKLDGYQDHKESIWVQNGKTSNIEILLKKNIVRSSPAYYLDSWEPKTSFDGRVGRIVFENNSLYPVNVTLWHPDSKKPFKTYRIAGQSKEALYYNGSKISIGSDWGLQVGSKKSAVKTVSDVSHWSSNSRQWQSSTSLFSSN